MNKLLSLHASFLTNCFEDYYKFDFNKELAFKAKQKGITSKNITEEKNYNEIQKIIYEISPLHPYFEFEGEKPLLKSRFYEILRYGFAIISFIRGFDQFLAGKDFLKHSNHKQFTIFALYQSIFHLQTSFLNLHGVVYFPKIISRWEVNKIKTFDGNKLRELIHTHTDWKEHIFGTFSNKNQNWDFSKIGLNHIDRWKKYADILKLYIKNNWLEQIPEDVKNFWGYLKVINEYKKNFWKQGLKYTIKPTKKELLSTLANYYDEPCKIRNEKIYENRKYDIMSFGWWGKAKKPPEEFIKVEGDFFYRYNKSLLIWQYSNLKEYLDFVEKKCSSHEVFMKGLDALIQMPIIKMNRYLLDSILNNEEIKNIKPAIPEFIRLFLFNY